MIFFGCVSILELLVLNALHVYFNSYDLKLHCTFVLFLFVWIVLTVGIRSHA